MCQHSIFEIIHVLIIMHYVDIDIKIQEDRILSEQPITTVNRAYTDRRSVVDCCIYVLAAAAAKMDERTFISALCRE